MDTEKILSNIIKDYQRTVVGSKAIANIRNKVEKGIATYADADGAAVACGRALNSAFKKYLPEALTDGYMFREYAETIIRQPVVRGARDVADITRRIQRLLNDKAGIGLDAIVPDLNMDQVNGIITGICNAAFADISDEFMSQIENLLLGYVDDFAHDNADFAYEAGLTPTIQRTAYSKCCEWCDALAGIYNYEDVRDRNNDVFRRHDNCRCLVMYTPAGSKRRQNVRTRSWT